MDRREVIRLGLGLAVASVVVPSSLNAINFRETKPQAWSAHTPEDALKALYGTNSYEEKGVKIKAPDIAENGAVIPITIKKVPSGTKTIAVFQDANPESCVAVFTIHPRSIVKDYAIRIKMKKTGKVTVVADVDGKLYGASKTVKVTIGGCGG